MVKMVTKKPNFQDGQLKAELSRISLPNSRWLAKSQIVTRWLKVKWTRWLVKSKMDKS